MVLIHLLRMDGRTMTYRIAAPLKTYEEPYVYTASGVECTCAMGGAFIEVI